MAKHILNPKETMAILIGVEEYGSFSSIPAASNNVAAFAEVLQADTIFGLPKEQIYTITEGDSRTIKRSIRELTNDAKAKGLKNLIFYFAGHGYRRADKSYYLVVNESEREDIEEDGETGIAYEFVKKHINKPHLERRIIFLDTCYSGLAAQSNSNDLGEAIQLKGSYIITSSNALEKSYFDTASEHTLFTEELLHIFRNGLPNKNEHISLAVLYRALKTNVKKRQPKMTPLQRIGEEVVATDFFLFKNNKFDKEAIVGKELEDEITKGEGIELLNKGKFKAAKNYFVGLITDVNDNIKNQENQVYLHGLLNENISECDNLIKYKRKLEKHFDFDKIRLERLSKDFNKIQGELTKMTESYQSLLNEFTIVKNEVVELKVMLKIKNSEIKKLNHTIKINENELRKSLKEEENCQKEYQIMRNIATENEEELQNIKRELQELRKVKSFHDSQKNSFIEVANNIKWNMIFLGSSLALKSRIHWNSYSKLVEYAPDFYVSQYPVGISLWTNIMYPKKTFKEADINNFLHELYQKTGRKYRWLTQNEILLVENVKKEYGIMDVSPSEKLPRSLNLRLALSFYDR